MNYRFAKDDDLDLLAQWNRQLIQDEGHRNPMTVAELRDRLQDWLKGEYRAVIFELDQAPVAYALFREADDEIYLRQLFVVRARRREGIGREAVARLRTHIWPQDRRLTVAVLTENQPAVRFWRSVGYRDYALTLEILPNDLSNY